MMIRMSVPTPMYTMPPLCLSRPNSFPRQCARQTPRSVLEKVWTPLRTETGLHERVVSEKRDAMGLVLLLVVLALLFGGVGLAASALWWMLIIAGALLIAGAFTGFGRRSTW